MKTFLNFLNLVYIIYCFKKNYFTCFKLEDLSLLAPNASYTY